ncbi:hypothetical protein BIW11_11251 [Tropilaelaps mercedesae]|uniref:Uncharacterized protein n=1 Tax=Tropilaelaps mercedesae TaxID=418985 RepID=A0A1V9XBV6_9ACAR|nr:hypothetical protein BIW11_11251 [Tropilaelaps mercedesae]
MASVELKTTETPETPETPECLDHKAEVDGVLLDVKTTETGRRPRKKAARFRKIPRSPVDDKENKGARLAGGGRQRTTSVSSVASGRSQRRGGKPSRRRTASEASAMSETSETSPMRKLRDHVMELFEKRGLNLLNSYIKNRMELAKFENTTGFLERCDSLRIVPNKYRLSNTRIKNTKHVIQTLDRFSFNLMFADLKYNRKRRLQVSKLLAEKNEKMRDIFGEELVAEILQVAGEAFNRRFNRIRDQQAKIFESLLKEYKITEEEKAEGEERLRRMEERERSRLEKRGQEKQSAGKGDNDEEAASPVKEAAPRGDDDNNKTRKNNAPPAGEAADGAGAPAKAAESAE